MNDNIKLSFCIPTYNRAQRVYDCVKHILEYQGNDIEVVVSNNASTDNTLELLGTITDERLTVHTNGDNIFSLNWPLAVSRATGQWAVLMSDEDIVNLDAIQVYINELLDPEIGMIIYSFPPVKNAIDFTYKCISQTESLYNVIKFCCHITGDVFNMSKTDIKGLDHYGDYCYPIKRGGNLEPQLRVAVENATENPVMLTEIPLCFYGRGEDRTIAVKKHDSNINKSAPNILDKNQYWGYAPNHRMLSMKPFVSHITENFIKPPETLYNAALRVVIARVGRFYGYLFTYENGPDAILWDAARAEYSGFDRAMAAKEMCDYFKTAVQTLVVTTKDDYWNRLIRPFEECFKQNYTALVPNDMSITESIMLGDTLFTVILNFYRNFDEETLDALPPEKYYANDFGDSLGMKSREIMRKHMRDKDYDRVIQLEAPDNIRTRYIKGEAYFHKNDIEKARECFTYVLEKTLNPRTLDDIIINEIAVQYSLYYMAVISARENEHEKAKEYMSECERISDELLIRGNLASPGLPKYEL